MRNPATISTIEIDNILPNPHRDLGTYPWIELKIDQLMRSISDVGFWEGIIARPVGDHFELAFGHHRLEAARRLGFATVPVIVRNLSDLDMLKFMGRENGEDYSADFQVMLNTWEGAERYSKLAVSKKDKPLDIARILGWAAVSRCDNAERMTPVAAACHSAFLLINKGYLARADLQGLSVHSAREIVVRAQQRAKDIEDLASEKKTPRHALAHTRKRLAAGVKATIKEVREGTLARSRIRARVDVNSFGPPKSKKRAAIPLFTEFAAALLKSVRISFETDMMAQYLGRVEEALPEVTLAKDWAILGDIQHELEKVETRVGDWKRRLTKNKVVPLRIVGEKEGE